jgi:hypothetical protein
MRNSGKITATEAAQRARMSRERLMRRVQTGHIRGELVAGRWLIDSRSLDDYLTQQLEVRSSSA